MSSVGVLRGSIVATVLLFPFLLLWDHGIEGSPIVRGFRREARSRGPLPLFRHGAWGYMDLTGKIIITPHFEAADFFYDNRAAVRVQGKWGFIDPNGSVVIQPQFTSVGSFSDGVASIYIDSPTATDRIYGYVDLSGQLVFKCPTACGDHRFSDGLMVGAIDRINCVDESGAGVPKEYPCTPDAASKSHPVFTHRGGYYDKHGNRAMPALFAVGAGPFAEGLAFVQPYGTQMFGYIDKSGTYVIPPRFDGAETFSEGLAGIAIGPHWGFIDHAGHIIVEPQFDAVGTFSGGYAPAFRDGRAGYIDSSGQLHVSFRFVEAEGFSEGLAAVCCESGRTGYINTYGVYVIPPAYPPGSHVAGPFAEGVAVVQASQGPVYINRAGSVVATVLDDSLEANGKGHF